MPRRRGVQAGPEAVPPSFPATHPDKGFLLKHELASSVAQDQRHHVIDCHLLGRRRPPEPAPLPHTAARRRNGQPPVITTVWVSPVRLPAVESMHPERGGGMSPRKHRSREEAEGGRRLPGRKLPARNRCAFSDHILPRTEPLSIRSIRCYQSDALHLEAHTPEVRQGTSRNREHDLRSTFALSAVHATAA